jgi:hypothetical protein
MVEPIYQRLKLFLIARRNYNKGAGAGKLCGDRFANPTAGAGYQNDLTPDPCHS